MICFLGPHSQFFPINITKFPDGTRQVWKNENIKKAIYWDFEDEYELSLLCQARLLMPQDAVLVMPFVPYARQDKDISNENTYALHSFLRVIKSLNFKKIFVMDVHSQGLFKTYDISYENIVLLHEHSTSVSHNLIIDLQKIIIFPDKGAELRYAKLFTKHKTICGNKVRDSVSGSLKLLGLSDEVPAKREVVVVDDICDGGATFIELLKFIPKNCHKTLLVSHGIFSKGVDLLKKAGYDQIHACKRSDILRGIRNEDIT